MPLQTEGGVHSSHWPLPSTISQLCLHAVHCSLATGHGLPRLTHGDLQQGEENSAVEKFSIVLFIRVISVQQSFFFSFFFFCTAVVILVFMHDGEVRFLCAGVPVPAHCEQGQVESGDCTHETDRCHQTLSHASEEGETTTAPACQTAALCQQPYQLPHDQGVCVHGHRNQGGKRGCSPPTQKSMGAEPPATGTANW